MTQRTGFGLSGACIVCGMVLLLSCAQVVAPPGGLPDRTPPKLVSSQPENGSVNVVSSDRIIIKFSEAVKPGVGRQVYLSPRPAKEPKLKWRNDELVVVLPDTFRTGQTYILQVSSALRQSIDDALV